MTNPTHDDQDGRPRLRLELDSGELLEVDGITVDAPSGAPLVVLRMTRWRAQDLAHVLETYTKLHELVNRSAQVSGTEESLSRALADAAALLAPARPPVSPGLGKVTSGRRLRAMAVLQEFRPDLDHSALIAVVDAAAMWTDAREDYYVTDLLRAVAGDDAAGSAYLALTGINERQPPAGPERSEGLPS